MKFKLGDRLNSMGELRLSWAEAPYRWYMIDGYAIKIVSWPSEERYTFKAIGLDGDYTSAENHPFKRCQIIRDPRATKETDPKVKPGQIWSKNVYWPQILVVADTQGRLMALDIARAELLECDVAKEVADGYSLVDAKITIIGPEEEIVKRAEIDRLRGIESRW